jgi:hypothetical protein
MQAGGPMLVTTHSAQAVQSTGSAQHQRRCHPPTHPPTRGWERWAAAPPSVGMSAVRESLAAWSLQMNCRRVGEAGQCTAESFGSTQLADLVLRMQQLWCSQLDTAASAAGTAGRPTSHLGSLGGAVVTIQVHDLMLEEGAAAPLPSPSCRCHRLGPGPRWRSPLQMPTNGDPPAEASSPGATS